MANNNVRTNGSANAKPLTLEQVVERIKKDTKLTGEQKVRMIRAIENKVKRAAYQEIRNKRPEVLAKRKEYNRKRYQEDRELLKLAVARGIVQVKKVAGR